MSEHGRHGEGLCWTRGGERFVLLTDWRGSFVARYDWDDGKWEVLWPEVK